MRDTQGKLIQETTFLKSIWMMIKGSNRIPTQCDCPEHDVMSWSEIGGGIVLIVVIILVVVGAFAL